LCAAALALVLMWPAHLSSAQEAGAFSRLGFGARGIAMGNGLAADVGGDASPYYNPALAPFASGQQVELSAALMRFDRQLQYVQFASPLRPRAGLAAGLIHAGVSNIDGRDNNGFHTEDLSTSEFAFFLSFGLRFGSRVSGGISLQLYRTDLYEGLKPARSVGIDVGLTAAVTEALTVALVLDDALARYDWDTGDLFGDSGGSTRDYFPLRLRLGASYAVENGRGRVVAEYESAVTRREYRTPVVLLAGGVPIESLEVAEKKIQNSRLRLGGEYAIAGPLSVRAGIDNLGTGSISGSRPSAGFMLEAPIGKLRTQAEYAFVLEAHAVGTIHLLSLKFFL
jgi:hypothetical protein